eukprot:1928145-Heterocapsa_arctica.AAC.1
MANDMRQWENGVDYVRQRGLLQVHDHPTSSGEVRYPNAPPQWRTWTPYPFRQRSHDQLHQVDERQGSQLEEHDERGKGEGDNYFLATNPKERNKLAELGAVRISRKEALDIIKSKTKPFNYFVIMVAEQHVYVDDTAEV